ncbi:MAG: sulfite exporter TauE/SafE family protein [Ignavibacteriae bacterium]|nr:sulfite exporter TauE/SafE family protein [Ignavibacteriota bacterium]
MTDLHFLIVLIVTFFTSTLTLLTGFGVGTVLTPAFAFFYDAKTAVFLVSIVHLANNLLKFGLFRRHIDKKIFIKFGIVSFIGAAVGSSFQNALAGEYVRYALAGFFLLAGGVEFMPSASKFRIPHSFDIVGGFFSGFLGGIIGNQGAIRSAYLLNYSLSKESFIATATAIAIVIDLTRIPVYLYNQLERVEAAAAPLLIVIAVAFAGTLFGKSLLKKISLERFRMVVAGFLVLMGVALFL